MQSWQSTLGVNSKSSKVPCGSSSADCREVPDVSADADPSSGYVVYYKGGWTAFGGTSAAAPLWAAFVALADEAGTSNAGFLNNALYAHDGDFDHITGGNNDYTDTNNGLYPATPGTYNMADGLGTPTAALLVPGVLAGANPNGSGTMAVSPGSVPNGSTGNSLTFTYTAATFPGTTASMNSGSLEIVVPGQWSAPAMTSGQPGYTSTTCAGTLATSGADIEMTGLDARRAATAARSPTRTRRLPPAPPSPAATPSPPCRRRRPPAAWQRSAPRRRSTSTPPTARGR